MKNKHSKKLSPKELVWYILAGLLIFTGLFMVVFGIIGHQMNVPYEQNFIKQAEKNMFLEFRLFGLIFLGSGMIIGVIALVYFAKTADREIEKTIRRQQRLSSSLTAGMEIKPAVQTIEVEPEADKKPQE